MPHSYRRLRMRHIAQTALAVVFLFLVGCVVKNATPPSGSKPANTPSDSQPVAQTKDSSRVASAQEDPASKEKTKLVGTWIATGGETQGIRMDAGAVADMKWTF